MDRRHGSGKRGTISSYHRCRTKARSRGDEWSRRPRRDDSRDRDPAVSTAGRRRCRLLEKMRWIRPVRNGPGPSDAPEVPRGRVDSLTGMRFLTAITAFWLRWSCRNQLRAGPPSRESTRSMCGLLVGVRRVVAARDGQVMDQCADDRRLPVESGVYTVGALQLRVGGYTERGHQVDNRLGELAHRLGERDGVGVGPCGLAVLEAGEGGDAVLMYRQRRHPDPAWTHAALGDAA